MWAQQNSKKLSCHHLKSDMSDSKSCMSGHVKIPLDSYQKQIHGAASYHCSHRQHYANLVTPRSPIPHLLLLNHSNTNVRGSGCSLLVRKPATVTVSLLWVCLSYQDIISPNQSAIQHHIEPVNQCEEELLSAQSTSWDLFENSLDEFFGIDSDAHQKAPTFPTLCPTRFSFSSSHTAKQLIVRTENYIKWILLKE